MERRFYRRYLRTQKLSRRDPTNPRRGRRLAPCEPAMRQTLRSIRTAPRDLFIEEEDIQAIARERLRHESLARTVLRQAWAEARLRFARHVRFRSRKNGQAIKAYRAMEIAEFEGINARQRWA